MIDLAALKAAAGEAMPLVPFATPETTLALIDEIETLRARVAELETKIG